MGNTVMPITAALAHHLSFAAIRAAMLLKVSYAADHHAAHKVNRVVVQLVVQKEKRVVVAHAVHRVKFATMEHVKMNAQTNVQMEYAAMTKKNVVKQPAV